MKQKEKNLARNAFGVFCKMDTQSWWAKVVKENLRNLGPAPKEEPKEEAPKEEAPKEEAPNEEAPKEEAPPAAPEA
jgi:hypothetical protein